LTPPVASGPAYLFCPASRPDRYQKAVDAADVAILDLEDAVAPDDKATARQHLIDNPVDPTKVIVRINPTSSPQHALDLAALEQTAYRRLMMPKVEDPQALLSLEGYEITALCETARGVTNAPGIASARNVVALMWGAEDLVASLGGRGSRRADGSYLDVARQARANVLLAAGTAGRLAIDAVFLDIDDIDGLRTEAEEAALSGFAAKACIHPSQVDVVRAAFRPTDEQRAWAQRVVDAASAGGVTVVDGRMVDDPLLRQARAILAAS
jgi:citrate lyase subunit beta / citryl-CoA lyase